MGSSALIVLRDCRLYSSACLAGMEMANGGCYYGWQWASEAKSLQYEVNMPAEHAREAEDVFYVTGCG